MSRQTNIEIMVQQGGRWTIHARYPVTKKDAAIEEAKVLDKAPGIGAVKVIKEVYDAEAGTSNEYVIFKSTGVKMAAAAAAAGGGGQARAQAAPAKTKTASPSPPPPPAAASYDEDEDEVVAEKPKKSKAGKKKSDKPSTVSSILTKLLMVLIFAIAIAAMVTGMAVFTLRGDTLFGISMVGDSGANVFFAVFVVTFLVSASVMSFAFLGKESLATTEARAARQQAQTQARPAQAAPRQVQAPPPSAAEQELRDAAAELRDAAGGDGQPATADEVVQRSESAEGEMTALGEGQKIEPVEPLSPNGEKQKAYMMKFLGEGLETIKQDKKKLDNFSKFGVNLFLAGACEVLAQKRDVDGKERSRILSDSVQVMGFKKDNALQFSDNYESYLLQDARYMQMFQAGRNAMNTYFTDEASGPKYLQGAIADWSKPKPKEEENKVVTVMFTDMVGSTALTQTMGQQVAQQVVRAHNRIVREALTQFAGREIKHTGDGIMCSFAQASGGVDAAIQIQRQTLQHNRDNPNLPLHLKIGLNTGEPIAEDGDLFGSTVQLSARITDKAKSEEIFVPESVRMVCAGKNYKFINRGGFAMKGFDGDITLFEVVWDDAFYAEKQKAAKAAAPKAAPAAAPAPQAAPRPAVATARPAAAAPGTARSAAPPPGAGRPAAPPPGAARPAAAARAAPAARPAVRPAG